MREGPVGLCHLVCVFALLHRGAAVVGGVKQLTRQALLHCLFVAATRCVDDPADCESLTALNADFNWNLVRRTTNAARADFDRRRDVFERRMEQLERIGFIAYQESV